MAAAAGAGGGPVILAAGDVPDTAADFHVDADFLKKLVKAVPAADLAKLIAAGGFRVCRRGLEAQTKIDDQQLALLLCTWHYRRRVLEPSYAAAQSYTQRNRVGEEALGGGFRARDRPARLLWLGLNSELSSFPPCPTQLHVAQAAPAH